MATVNTRPYYRPRKGRSGFDLLHASDTPEDAQRLAAEGYKPADPDTARAAVAYNSKGWAQGEDAYRLGLKDRPVEVTIGTPPMLWRKEQPKAEDWGDAKRGGMTGAMGRELDAAGMLGPGDEVEVREGTPSLVSRTPATDQDWGDAKRSGMSNPRGGAPGITVGAASTGPDGYLDRAKASASPLARAPADVPFSEDELTAMFEGTGGSGTAGESADPELQAAQDAARERRLVAEIGRAGAQFNESLTGAKYDRAAYDGYGRDAERPVGDLLQRREAVVQRQGRARQAQQDRMRAEAEARAYRHQQQQDARQASNDAYQRERDAKGDARQQARDAEEARRFDLTRREAAANRALQRQAQADTRALARQAQQDAARAKAQEVADRNADKDRQELAKRASVAGELKDDIGTLNSAITRGRESLTGDIPGLGVWDSWKMTNPVARSLFASPEDIEVSEAVDRLSGNENRAMTGLSSTDSERRENKRRRGLDAGNSEEAAVQGISTLARDATTKLRGVEGGFNQDVVDEYRRRGGSTSADIPAPVSTRPTRSAVVMVAPNGRQYTVDPSEVDEAQRNGWRLK
jgi:hypothetical protein